MPHPVQPWLRIHEMLHPSDFCDAARAAFVHSLALAAASGARLTLMHMGPEDGSSPAPFPDARAVLAQWRQRGGLRRLDRETDVQVRQVRAAVPNPVEACLKFLHRSPADMIVLAVREREGKMLWLGSASAEPLARKSGEMTLFVPEDAKGFISPEDGALALRRVLVPVAHKPSPAPAIEAARRTMLFAPEASGIATVLCVGEPSDMPAVSLPDLPGWTWDKTTRRGDVVDAIVAAAEETAADLIVMTTEGRNGFLDALRGTTTERVLRKTGRPLLAMPVGSFLG